MRYQFAAAIAAGLVLAQTGIPQTPGTHVPESNPAISIPTPVGPPPTGSTTPTLGTAPIAPPPSGDTGPAYSFGTAPAPVVGPGR